MTKRLKINARVIPDGAAFSLFGRDAWMLATLLAAGRKGVSTVENPAPRISAYIHQLRKKYGLVIRTVDERHGGAFPGVHARYILVSQVEVQEDTIADSSRE